MSLCGVVTIPRISSRLTSIQKPTFARTIRVHVRATLSTRAALQDAFHRSRQFLHSRATNDWHPGVEPGVDPNTKDSFREDAHALHQECQISIHDFSPTRIETQRATNTTILEHIDKARPEWAQARWINVNGISWDVIRLLGRAKGLHRLAIEDLMNTRNRTKVDWYPDHAFVVLTLQRLIRLSGSQSKRHAPRQILSASATPSAEPLPSSDTRQAPNEPAHQERTLQSLHSTNSPSRQQFLSVHSPLTRAHLGIAVEQVALFLLSDNTIISFFEHSASYVEEPLLLRLQSSETIVRRSCDVGMVLQGIIDTIIDLAMPCVGAYERTIADLEVDVLTEPSIGHSKALYVLSSELQALRAQIQPIISVINALRDHHASNLLPEAGENPTPSISTSASPPTPSASLSPVPRPVHTVSSSHSSATTSPSPTTSIAISRLTHTYLGDVLDHAILLTSSLNSMSQSAASMISLIFNTMSVAQNETMRQLTFVTILFLPLTFLSGYFGMNFELFGAIKGESELYFWWLALPVTLVMGVILQRHELGRVLWRGVWQRRLQVGGRGQGGHKVDGAGSDNRKSLASGERSFIDW